MKCHHRLLILISVLLPLNIFANEFQKVPNPVSECHLKFFDKGAIVFGCVYICGTRRVSKSSIRHAAKVMAKWIDNYHDGKADDWRVLKALKESRPYIFMTYEGEPPERYIDQLYERTNARYIQPLWETETGPNAIGRDASQEEAHHVMHRAGWNVAYPKVFEIETNCELKKVWRIARQRGISFYDTTTPNNGAETIEFVYLAMAVYHNSQIDIVPEEMTINDKDELREELPEIFRIFERTRYNYSTNVWPNGRYKFKRNLKYLGKARNNKRR